MCLVPLESASRLQGWPCHRHPDAFADTLRELNPPNLFNPSAWTTRDDEHSLYDFKFFLDEAISGCLSDYLAFGHAGHGTNSYGLSYYLVCGDLALLLQVPWGGAYMDAERATREVNAALDWAGRISARFEAENSRPRGRFILASSGFYGSTVRCQLGDGRPEALDAIERWLHQGFVIHQERPPEVAAGTRIDRVYLNRGAQRMQMAEPIEGARASGEGTGPQQLEHPKVLADAEFEAGSGLDGEESGSSRPGIDRIELAEAIVRLFKGTYEAITVEDGRGSYVQIATFNRSGDAGSVIAFEIVDSGLRTKAHRLSGQYLPSEPYLTRDSETAL